MMAWFAENLGTLLISAVLLAVVVWIVAGLIKKKKSGKSAGCGCGCSGCPSDSLCHKE